jgi:putative intracellular protease/amidase
MKKFQLLFLALIPVFLWSTFTIADSSPKRVLMLIADDFWAPEYYVPRKLFDEAGFHVTVAGRHSGEIIPDARNINYRPVKVDITFDQVDLSKFDAIAFAGGNGAWHDFFPTESVHRIVTDAFKRPLVKGFLCASTGLLGLVGNVDGMGESVAKGRHVTGYFRVEGILRKLGVVRFDGGEKGKPYAVTDRDLVTGRDPESAEVFARAMLAAIQDSLNPSQAARAH